MTQGSNWLHFFYDGSGQPAEMNFNGTVYIYVKNLQGDIVGIVDTTGRIVVEYKYDAWGRPTYSNSLVDSNSTLTARYALMLTLNPFRYRGYVYDDEIGNYYCVDRYYSPLIGRFRNADAIIALNCGLIAKNLFCYCCNSPISNNDPYGFFINFLWNSIQNGLHNALHFINKKAMAYGMDTAAFGAEILNMEKVGHVYHAKFDTWQQYFGYNDVYDIVFDIFTSMERKKFRFGDKYMLWLWKGDYINLGAGAEIGIYTGDEPHWFVDKTLAMDMSMVVNYNGRNIITWADNTWWLTGFNPGYLDVEASELTVTYTVTFNNRDMYNLFDVSPYTNEWSLDPISLSASFTY